MLKVLLLAQQIGHARLVLRQHRCCKSHAAATHTRAGRRGTVVAMRWVSHSLNHQEHTTMKIHKSALFIALGLSASLAFAQQQALQPWTYKTKQLERAEIDTLLARPEKVLVIDVRRPDEVSAKGSFPVFLNVQAKEVEQNLAFIPKDRLIVTVSNHAHRAGAVGDLLTSKGFRVAGAAGSEDYEAQGGKIVRIAVPPRQIANASPAPAAAN
jgi:rhodanese-related sulfurtransferase